MTMFAEERMISNPVIFYIASILIILFAIFTLCAKKVINALLASVVVFFLGALFFYVIGSEYNAIIQASIYGFAVPIIIGVSILFENKKNREDSETNINSSIKKSSLLSYLTILFSGIFVLAFIYLVMMSLVMTPDTFYLTEPAQISAFENLKAFANGIFVNYVWAFELISLLLTIVIAGIGIIGSKKERIKYKSSERGEN